MLGSNHKVIMSVSTTSVDIQIVARTGMLAVVPRANMTPSSTDWSNIGSVVVSSALGHQPPARTRLVPPAEVKLRWE